MTMRTIALLLLSLSLLSVEAQAQGTLEPRTQGGVTYVSGGIGEGGREEIRAAERNYNLRLMFAKQGSGQYLADVHVSILDAKGTTLVDTDSEGPYFLAKLKPGAYKVVASTEGKTVTKSVEVPASGRAALDFYWSGVE